MALSLHGSAKRGDIEGLDQLLNVFHQDPDELDLQKMSALHYAAKRGQHESIRFLTKAKASLELKNAVGQTALHIASQADDVEIVKVLLEAGADPNTASDHAMRPIHRVSRTGCIDLLAVLVKYGADVHAADTFMGETAIHHAATAGNADCIRMLLSHSKKWMDDTNSRGETALHLAAAGGHFDCVKMLLLMGNTPEWKHEFINRKDSRQEDTALHKACEYGHTKVARMLIDEGAVVHAFNVLARTPLHYAAANRDPELVTFLIRAGANHLATDCDGRRPIQHVVHDEVRNAFESVTAGPRDRVEHISSTRLEIVSERRNAWRRAEQIRESGSDDNTVMQLLMEKEARAKRILMRRINQEKEDLVYRLRANGAQMCIVRCWREFKKRKEDKRKEEERQRRKQKAESERRKAEQAAMERALEEKKQRAKRQADSVARAPSRTASGESDGGMYASVMSLGPGAVASRTSSVSRAGSAENSLDAPVNEGDAVEEDQDLVEQMGGRLAMI